MTIAFSAFGQVQTLRVGSGSGSPGQPITVPITVDNPEKIAGASFTLQYSSNLTVTVASTFFDTFANQLNPLPEGVELPVVIDGVEYEQPLIVNPQTSGGTTRLLIAAARCTPAAAGQTTTIFTLTAQSAVSGQYEISISPTTLNNAAAGYDPNGETIDLIIGSDLSQVATNPAAFPVLLDDTGYASHVFAGTITVSGGPDADGDGLNDDWENKYGGVGLFDGNGNSDNDYWSDRQEHDNEVNNGIASNPTSDNSPGGFPNEAWFETDESMELYGDDFTIGNQPAAPGDKIMALDPQGVVCGVAVVQTAGQYGPLTIYGDDPATHDVDEGAQAGDQLTLMVWDASTGDTSTILYGMYYADEVYVIGVGNILPHSNPIHWTADGDEWGLNIATDYLNAVHKVYIAYYQRPADPGGLHWWNEEKLVPANGNLNEIIDAYANSEEANRLYGPINETTIGGVIDKIYNGLFNRAPDEAGKNWYISEYIKGTFTPGTIALSILDGARGNDLVCINHKLDYARMFVDVLDPDQNGQGPYTYVYGADDEADARNLLSTISDTIVKTYGEVEQDIMRDIAP
jgi:hypothetical protein